MSPSWCWLVTTTLSVQLRQWIVQNRIWKKGVFCRNGHMADFFLEGQQNWWGFFHKCTISFNIFYLWNLNVLHIFLMRFEKSTGWRSCTSDIFTRHFIHLVREESWFRTTTCCYPLVAGVIIKCCQTKWCKLLLHLPLRMLYEWKVLNNHSLLHSL